MDTFLSYFKSLRTYLGGVSVISGGLLVVVGVMIYADSLTLITSFLERHNIGWYIGQ
jgi:cytochrome c-type biogenesis protein